MSASGPAGMGSETAEPASALLASILSDVCTAFQRQTSRQRKQPVHRETSKRTAGFPSSSALLRAPVGQNTAHIRQPLHFSVKATSVHRPSPPGRSTTAGCPSRADRKSTRLNSSHQKISY